MSKYYFQVEGGFIFHLPSYSEQDEIRKIWNEQTDGLFLNPSDLQKQAPDLFTMLIAYTRCHITLDKSPLGFSLDELDDYAIIEFGIKIGNAEQGLLDQLEENVIDTGVDEIFTRSWWYRDKYKLTPNDPRFLALTDYDINKEWYASEAKATLANYKTENNFEQYSVDELEERIKADLKGEIPDSLLQAQQELEALQQFYYEKQQKEKEEETSPEQAPPAQNQEAPPAQNQEAPQETMSDEEFLKKSAEDYFDDSLWKPFE